MTLHRNAALVALIASLAWASMGHADPPCLSDIQKLCSDTPSGAGQIQACLKAHEADLSKACKQHVGELKRTARELAAVCVWDMERFCSNVSPGGGRIATCLQQNRDDLSPECKDRFSRHKGS